MHICACAWIYAGQKNCGKSRLGYRAFGPPLGHGGPWAAGRWAAGQLLAKPCKMMTCGDRFCKRFGCYFRNTIIRLSIFSRDSDLISLCSFIHHYTGLIVATILAARLKQVVFYLYFFISYRSYSEPD